MIEKIIRYSAANRFIVLIIVAALVFGGIWSIRNIAVDALPDLSDTQVIVYSTWDRSPDIIEDQVTYPVITSLLGAPHVKAIRGFSDFGYSYVYVIFEEGTDIYWARSRVLEYLSKVQSQLPQGVHTSLGPDATGVGWVYQYALVDTTGQRSLADLRSLEDWHIRYELQSVSGVAEVASVGGFVRQYQITVDPNKLAAYGIPLMQLTEAVKKSNNEVGGRLIEWSGAEYMVRAHGYVKSAADLEEIAIKTDERGTPVRLRDVATVSLGPELRRGIAELDGKGEVAAGIVVMRHGENAMNVITRVKERLKEIEPSLPKGVKIVETYDRSELIQQSIHTLKHELLLEMIIVSLIILIFLWHVPSAFIPIITIPAAVIMSFIPMKIFGINSNIPAQLLLAAGHRPLVHAHLCPRSAGRKALQAAGLYEELFHGLRRRTGRHARPSDDAADHPDAKGKPEGKPETRNQKPEGWWVLFWFLVSGFWFPFWFDLRNDSFRRKAPHLPIFVSRLWSSCAVDPSTHTPGDRAGVARGARHNSDLLPARPRVHAAAR